MNWKASKEWFLLNFELLLILYAHFSAIQAQSKRDQLSYSNSQIRYPQVLKSNPTLNVKVTP